MTFIAVSRVASCILVFGRLLNMRETTPLKFVGRHWTAQ
jgi:hypothetical protein